MSHEKTSPEGFITQARQASRRLRLALGLAHGVLTTQPDQLNRYVTQLGQAVNSASASGSDPLKAQMLVDRYSGAVEVSGSRLGFVDRYAHKGE